MCGLVSMHRNIVSHSDSLSPSSSLPLSSTAGRSGRKRYTTTWDARLKATSSKPTLLRLSKGTPKKENFTPERKALNNGAMAIPTICTPPNKAVIDVR
mmetsp:Transcript_34225/g.82757  ORF Transcript_34225/g.82757 Transcript_34225/m.82757 type:complete len:98 (+) Transcript_34225:443-736(+)